MPSIFTKKQMGEKSIWSIDKHKNHHFDDDKDIHMGLKKYEASGYRHDLGRLIISH